MLCCLAADGRMRERGRTRLLLAFWTKRTLPALAEAAWEAWARPAVATQRHQRRGQSDCLPLLLSEVTASTLGDGPSGGAPERYSARWRMAATVMTRILKSRPSDQFSM